jgi:hypothetical protein
MSYKLEPKVSLDAPAEIDTLTAKAVPVAADLLVIEDSADSFNKKKVEIGNLPGGGGGGGTFALPHYFDNVTAQYAEMVGNPLDSAWTGGDVRFRVVDGTNTKTIKVINFAGSAPTADEYDAGGGTGFSAALIANCFKLNVDAGDLLTTPHWEKFEYNYNPATFGFGWVTGGSLFLESTTQRHDLIDVYALGGVRVYGSLAALDTIDFMGVTFTAVAGGAVAANQEFDDVANSGSAAATATSLSTAINDAASQALLNAAAPVGVVVAANTDPTDTDTVVLDSGGVDFAIVYGGTDMQVLTWDDLSTAIVTTPGADLS